MEFRGLHQHKMHDVAGLSDNWNVGFGTATGISSWIFSASKNVLDSVSPTACRFNPHGKELVPLDSNTFSFMTQKAKGPSASCTSTKEEL